MNDTRGHNRNVVSSNKSPGGSHIPLRRPLSRQSSTASNSKVPTSDQIQRWKQKYEDAEEKRKILLSEKEKALRSLKELEKKHLHLQENHEHLETELFEKNEEFTRLSTASKNLYKEYETLKNQYETETGAMEKVLKDASHWYKENKELKRKTLLLEKDTVDEGVDAGDASSDNDIENLNKTIKQLSTDVAELQTELDSLRQTEFQTSEQNTKLLEELESEKKKNVNLECDLADLRKQHAQVLRVTEMMKKEIEDLKEMEENHRQSASAFKKEADDYKKERNVLAHQSTLLLQGLNDSSGTDYIMLLQEIEELKRTIEDERNRYEEEINSLQERLEDQDNNSQSEILEERLKLAESELQSVNSQVEIFEQRLKFTESELKVAVQRAEEAERKLRAPPPPPPPPPLMVPPPPPPPIVPLRRRRSRATVQELAETIGIQEKEKNNNSSPEKKPNAPGVNEDIINAIKEGKFTLKKAKSENKKNSETPKAVSEILNILGTLRRAPKKRQSQCIADVQL